MGNEPELPLFAYGTLEIPEIIEALTGRAYTGRRAVLEDWARYLLKDSEYPGGMPVKGAKIPGLIYEDFGETALMLVDHYEGELYERLQLVVKDEKGESVLCWVYVIRPERRDVLTDQEWDRETFVKNHLANYLSEI